MLTYDEMIGRTVNFYKELGVKIPSDKIKDAVASLTMPQYASIFKQKYKDTINEHRSLATLGDAVCGALLLMGKYRQGVTMKKMTIYKEKITNKNLNFAGKELLKDSLFHENNDLSNKNKKSYATAFEAIIGFLSLVDLNKAKLVFEKYIEI